MRSLCVAVIRSRLNVVHKICEMVKGKLEKRCFNFGSQFLKWKPLNLFRKFFARDFSKVTFTS